MAQFTLICPDGASLEPSCRREDAAPATLKLYHPAIRTDLVERVRREIAEGIYDTPEKFDIALERLLDRYSRD